MNRKVGRSAAQTISVFAFGFAALAGQAALASGFEKTVLWSGRYSGAGGVTAPNVAGAEALAFNPAGILGATSAHEVNANISVLQSQFKGPVGADNVQTTGQTTYSSPFALIYAGKLSEDLAFAVGGYTAGGAKAEFNDVPFPISGTTNNARLVTVKTNLAVQEFAAGVAYRPMEKLRIGAAWRAAFVNANFASVGLPAGSNTALANIEFSNLKDSQYLGYRLGAQWTEDNWGVGLAYRSEFQFKASGDANGVFGQGASTQLSITSPGVVVGTVLPQQLTAGGYFDVDPKIWRILLEYAFTNYARVGQIDIEGQYTISGIGQRTFMPLRMNWLDQHNVRLGGEYGGAVVPIRFGYVWTSQVTSSDYARASFVPPGAAHTFTLGTGMTFMDSLRTDLGFDYTMASGTGNSGSSDPTARAGDYAVNAVSLFLGASYAF